MQATVRGSSLPVFKQWLKVASSQGIIVIVTLLILVTLPCVMIDLLERDVVLRMLQAGYTADTEEVRLKKAVGKVLRPDSAVKVQEWLKSASESGAIVTNKCDTMINTIGTLQSAKLSWMY